jgi:hypothetical protein
MLPTTGLMAIDEGSTFIPFPRLPTELRLKIWSCCFEPQVIDIWIFKTAPSRQDRSIYEIHPPEGNFVLTPKRIPLWYICHESRDWAKEQGILLLHGDVPSPKWREWNVNIAGLNVATHSTRTLFEPKHDLLCLHRKNVAHMDVDLPRILTRLRYSVSSHVRYLGLYYEDFDTLTSGAPGAWLSLRALESLEVVVVVGKEFDDGLVHVQLHIIKRNYDTAQLQENSRRWRMPDWRFVRTASQLEVAVKEGKVRELEGVDADHMVPH